MFAFFGALVIGILLIDKWAYTETNAPKQETQDQVIENITPEKAHTLIQKNMDNPSFVILDVRTPQEFSDGHIENAISLDFYSENFRYELDKLDKDKTYIIHCRSGSRSARTLDIMKEFGFKEVLDMEGGIIKWKEKGFPITK